MTAGSSFAQSADNQARFEVASVRPHQGGGGSTRRIEPDGITYLNITLGEFIQLAYGIKHREISGSSWVVDFASSDRYDVVAKAASPVPWETVKRMLATLSAERFHLAVHQENRELAVYALVVGKKGPKFKPGDGGPPHIQSDAFGGTSYRNYSMKALALRLSDMRSVGRPVLDRTGLPGGYNFTAKLEDILVERGPDHARAIKSDQPIFADLQEPLGLKLESQKAPVEMLVVDRAEKVPTED